MYIELYWSRTDPVSGDIEIDTSDYQIKDLSFAPQTDLTGNSMPVNEYTCDVILAEPLPGELTGGANLYDDRGRLWSAWPLTKITTVTEKCLRVTASSWLRRLEYIDLPEKMFTGESASVAIAECFGTYTGYYTLSYSIGVKTVSGFAPAQTARERLTWLLFVLGAYCWDIYRTDIAIKPVDATEDIIPASRTFWRPSVERGAWVTGLRITTYAFRQGTEEEWQNDDASYMFPIPWIATEQHFELGNPNAPDDVPPNVVEIDGIYLINQANVSEFASRLSNYWFNPLEASVDCINNRSYVPGSLVTAQVGEEELITGYVQQETFKFGHQARSTLKLVAVERRPSANLVVNYRYDGKRIGRAKYRLPVGYAYTIENPYLDQTAEERRRIYRPLTESVTGTLPAGGAVENVDYAIALELYEGVLHIISVDEVTQQEISGEQIGVIA